MDKDGTLKGKTIILSITGNIATDQRVHKVATSLIKIGLKPTIISRKSITSRLSYNRNYKTKQLRLLFSKGPLFYAEFNIRLFFILLLSKSNILLSNDLDTLLANYLAYKFKRIFRKKVKLVYDSHEIFTEVPELINRKLVEKIWLYIEKIILPKLKNTYTVCEPIAEYYRLKYGVNMQVIKNLSGINVVGSNPINLPFKIPENKKIILYQGALNIGRGIEHVIPLMENIDNAIFIIIGTGDIEQQLKNLVAIRKLNDKVIFTGNISMELLNGFTSKAHIGLILLEDLGLNYHYALPNRVFDFIRAGVPILASDLPEIARIVKSENIGITQKGFDPDLLLENIKMMLNDTSADKNFRKNLEKCKEKYYWDNQEPFLFDLFMNLND